MGSFDNLPAGCTHAQIDAQSEGRYAIEPNFAQLLQARLEVQVVLDWGQHRDATFDDVLDCFDKLYCQTNDHFANYPHNLVVELEAADAAGVGKMWMIEPTPEVAETIKRYAKDYIGTRAYEIAAEDVEHSAYE